MMMMMRRRRRRRRSIESTCKRYIKLKRRGRRRS